MMLLTQKWSSSAF